MAAATGNLTLAVAWVLTGHIFPVFWKLNGGVGVAVAMGAAFGLLPFGVLIAAAETGLALALTRTAIYSVWLFFGVTLMAGACCTGTPLDRWEWCWRRWPQPQSS